MATRTARPLSRRKYWAVMHNLAKARRTPRTRASYLRSRHNATKHGLYVRRLEGSFVRLGENPRAFAKLHALLVQILLPQDVTEKRLVRRLAEAVWRRFRAYHAAPGWQQKELARVARQMLPAQQLDAERTTTRSYDLLSALLEHDKFARQSTMALGEVERMLRLLLIYRSGNPRFDFHFVGRQHLTEITELSTNPKNWARRYAAAVPLEK